MGTWGRTIPRSLENHLGINSSRQHHQRVLIKWRLLNKVLPTSDRLSRQGLVDAGRNCPLCGICRETVEHMFFHCREIKAAYAFWFVLANKCMSPTGTVPAITKLTCADMVIGMKDQPRSATTNTLASMLLYSIWVTRNQFRIDNPRKKKCSTWREISKDSTDHSVNCCYCSFMHKQSSG